MKFNLREIIQGLCMIGAFISALFVEANIGLSAAIMLGCLIVYFLIEKGIM